MTTPEKPPPMPNINRDALIRMMRQRIEDIDAEQVQLSEERRALRDWLHMHDPAPAPAE